MACTLLTDNHVFLVQFELNQHSYDFQERQISLALRARAIWLAFKQFTRAYLSQIVLEIL